MSSLVELPDRAEETDTPFQGDLFTCVLTPVPVKDDVASMGLPIFSLSKNPDLRVREYVRDDVYVRITPPAIGAATIFDKDLLLYAASQLIAAKNNKQPVSQYIEIDASDFLKTTARGDGRASFERILDMLNRLNGTKIVTTRPTTDDEQTTEPFSLIETFRITSKKSRKAKGVTSKGKPIEREIIRVTRFQIKLSEWFYKNVLHFQVLTLDPGYYRLTSAIARRLYEIARKHCGHQAVWKIGIDQLGEKIGSVEELRFLRREIRKIITEDNLPEYRVALDTKTKPHQVVFYTRNGARLSKHLVGQNEFGWYQRLERCDNITKRCG